MQKLKKVIIWCFPCSDVDTDDKGLMLTSNASHTQTGSARVPVCFSGENCVFRLPSNGFYKTLADWPQCSGDCWERKSLIFQFSEFCQWQIASNYHELSTNLSYTDNYPRRNQKIIARFSHLPSRITAVSIKSFELDHSKHPFCANDTFSPEHKQSQTSAHDD